MPVYRYGKPGRARGRRNAIAISPTAAIVLDVIVENKDVGALYLMKISAPSVVSNQSDTVVRKLPIMTLTPTITLTAMVNAATAIEVRLSERVTARGAMRPKTPNIHMVKGAAKRIMTIKTMGVNKALPITMQNNAPKLI